MSSSMLLLGLLQLGQAAPLPSNDDFAEQMRQRPAREATAETPISAASAWLQQCLDQMEQDPSRAHTQAQIRRNSTIGTDRVLANHCLGLAATELGLWDDARTAFIAARDETPESELRTRARFGTMAGNAMMQSGDLSSALTLLTRAENDADLAAEGSLAAYAAMDRARVLVALEQDEEALTALEKATSLLPGSSEAWLYKATLLRRLDRLDPAQAAILTATGVAPMDPQIGLEAGVIAVLQGRDDDARARWQSILDTLPDSPEASAARSYLAQLGPAPDTENALTVTP